MATDAGRKGERDLVRLVYRSAAAPCLTVADLDAIASCSAERNGRAGLTGLLLHQGEGFFGILEGPRRRLFARMERIIVDPRHARLDILVEAPTAARRFAGWSFASLPGSVAVRPAAEDFVQALSRRLR